MSSSTPTTRTAGPSRCAPRARGRQLYARITDDLVEQQKQLLQDLDPDVRDGVVEVIRAACARRRFTVPFGRVGRRAAARRRATAPACADFFAAIVVTDNHGHHDSDRPTADAAAIAGIYNQGIEERGATFETDAAHAPTTF